MRQSLTMLMCLLFFSTFSQERITERIFSAKELSEDLSYLIKNLEEIHPDLYAYTEKKAIDEMLKSIREKVDVPMTRKQFALMVIPAIAALRDAHTALMFPQEERTEYLEEGGRIFPFEVRISDNRIFVRANYTADSTIHINAEILSINEIKAEVMLDEMRKYISAELDFYRDIRIEREFRRMLWYIYGIGDEVRITLSQREAQRTKSITGITEQEFNRIIALKGRESVTKPFSFYRLDGNTGVIDFRQMNNKGKFGVFLDSVFTVLKQDQVKNLVIDIRRNGGGNSQLADMLFNYITDKPYKMVEQMDIKASRKAKRSFRKNNLKWYLYPLYPVALFHPHGRPYLFGRRGQTYTIKPKRLTVPDERELKFHGRTFLLTSHYTFSSANMLAAAYKCYGMGTIIGEETGGVLTAFGDLIRFQLPNTKLNAFCSHKRFVHPCNDDKIHGVKPDIEVKDSLEDLKNNRDAVMEYVKSVVTQQSQE